MKTTKIPIEIAYNSERAAYVEYSEPDRLSCDEKSEGIGGVRIDKEL